MNITTLKNILEEEHEKTKGTYKKAIILYALELVDNINDNHTTTQEQKDNIEKVWGYTLRELALSGAENFEQYSWGGCSLCYNYDILNRLFCPSIVKRYENSDRVNGIHLLDLQANALAKALVHIKYIIQTKNK